MLATCQERYARQVNFIQIRPCGQERLATATVVIVGCGALGTVAAELLARAGVGHLRLVDDDHVQWVNLVGQTLFDEQDARTGQPKAVAACRELRRLNSSILVEPIKARLNAHNAETLIAGADLVLDGTDNDATRYLINQACLRQDIPWVFAGVLENYGLIMNIVPGQTPCFACIFGPSSSSTTANQPTCALTPATHAVASLQVSQALRLLMADREYTRGLVYVDAAEPSVEKVEVKSPQTGCSVCGRR